MAAIGPTVLNAASLLPRLANAADAIRKNITELKDESRGIEAASDYIILSGSAVYNMDFSQAGGRRQQQKPSMLLHARPESSWEGRLRASAA